MRNRPPDPEVEGFPDLALRDEEREQLADLLADALIEAIEQQHRGTIEAAR
jgi:hypothetical protein